LGTSVTEFVAGSYSAAWSGTVCVTVCVEGENGLPIWRGRVRLSRGPNEFVFMDVLVARTK
jgi:hypothetical protein